MFKISYDRLGDHAKQVFLDIVGFFKGEKEEYVKKILEEFGTTSNINVLIFEGCGINLIQYFINVPRSIKYYLINVYWLLSMAALRCIQVYIDFTYTSYHNLLMEACSLTSYLFQIPIFEKGYEKDPVIVSKESIREALCNGSDVIIVNTVDFDFVQWQPLQRMAP